MGFLNWFGKPDEVRLTMEELAEALALVGATPKGLVELAQKDSAELSRRAAEESKRADGAYGAVMASYNTQLRKLQLERDSGLANVANARRFTAASVHKARVQASIASKIAGS